MNFIKKLILQLLRWPELYGLVFIRRWKSVEPRLRPVIRAAMGKSFCSYSRFAALIDSLSYLERAGIRGDIVICGVAHGGLAKVAMEASFLRTIWLYDLYDGGTLPGVLDGDDERRNAVEIKSTMVASEAQVKRYLGPDIRLKFVTGDVMKTIPETMPSKIALLYLDTDWYDTTAHELKHLYPLVEPGGVVIQDDYGFFIGAKRAVDEALQGGKMLVALDDCAVLWVK
jgi:O-methyltransferase